MNILTLHRTINWMSDLAIVLKGILLYISDILTTWISDSIRAIIFYKDTHLNDHINDNLSLLQPFILRTVFIALFRQG